MLTTVRLKNNTEEAAPLVTVVMLAARDLFDTKPIVAYEAICVARDPKHKPWGNTGKDLEALGWLDASGSMPNSIRNILVSAAVGDDLDMTIGNPIVQEE